MDLDADNPVEEDHRLHNACFPLETHCVGDLVVAHRRDIGANETRLLCEEGEAAYRHDRVEDEILDIYSLDDHSHDQNLYCE